MLTSVVVLYALTAGIAGYVSAALYKIMGGASRVTPGCRWSRLACDGWDCCRLRIQPPFTQLCPDHAPALPARAPLLPQAPTGCATC